MSSTNQENQYLLSIDEKLNISFQRTLRIPDDDRNYPLPPSLGAFPIFNARNYLKTPAHWRTAGDLFVPMFRREAMWIGLRTIGPEPCAVQIGAGDVNAITGISWTNTLTASPQNYLVCPLQPWLDGINIGQGRIRQFVAVDIDSGESVESQLNPSVVVGGIRVAIHNPKPGLFDSESLGPDIPARDAGAHSMALAAGGQMRQKIYPDPYGIQVWEEKPIRTLRVHIVTSREFRELTGGEAPQTLVTASEYTNYGFPWFELYDEDAATLDATSELNQLKSVGAMDRARNLKPDTMPVDIPQDQIRKLKLT